ncbi:hypothetical protein [Nocardia sp. XZ_19_369]|uniref:hypothetical protein n=1 Tax=Nocardia sp. XZ_19_369 TaxID=2769487 RepID=UPI00188E5FDB|nr:hypothetical protein [Nocardia sp. XZ_19_369]
MTSEQPDEFAGVAIELARKQEQVRQLRETFNQRKKQDGRWFVLKLAMGWISVVLLPGIAITSGYIIFNFSDFEPATVTAATATLFVDTLGLVMSVWRLVLGKGHYPLQPIDDSAPTTPDAATVPVKRAASRRNATR